MLVSIEGNIGSGKSTLINCLHDLPDVTIMHEPVDKWRNLTGHTEGKTDTNILDTYYHDPKRWAYTFQTFAFITRYMDLKDLTKRNNGNNTVISERSHLSDREIFANTLVQNGDICDLEMKMYLYWFNHLSGDHMYDKIVYLRTDPEVAFNRLRSRGRPEENQVSLDFITKIHQAHDQWLLNERNIQVLILDGNIDINENQEILQQHKQQILSFLCE